VKLGFPRAFYYFDYYPFWAGFFNYLEIELVTSPATNREILELGLKKANDATCLPIKILVGHLQVLSNVDAIFLPRLVSVEEDTYLCPKYLGIPESVLTGIPEGIPVLSVTVNWRQGVKYSNTWDELGPKLGKQKSQIRAAFKQALAWQQEYEQLKTVGWDFNRLIAYFEHSRRPSDQEKFRTMLRSAESSTKMDKKLMGTQRNLETEDKRPRIAIVGHSYLTHDAYANLNLLAKLRAKSEVQLIDRVNSPQIEKSLLSLRKKMFWSHGKRILGAGYSFTANENIDGIIYLSCFGCGTDSITQEMVARAARQEHKPYMIITLDEHTGEAGLVTRLEAFLDMLKRRNKGESNLSAHGKCLDRDSNAL